MRPRRRHERFVRRLETEFNGDGKTYRAISSDFSRYGLFIRTNHAFVPGTSLAIVIHLPDGTKCSLQGIVRRALKTPMVSLKNGMGIELTRRDENYVRFLKKFDPSELDEANAQPQSSRTSSAQPEGRTTPDTGHEVFILTCIACGAKNKVPKAKIAFGPKCGRCKAGLGIAP